MKKVYWPNKEYHAGFPQHDDNGWYKEVSETELEKLLESGSASKQNGICVYAQSAEDGEEALYANPGKTLKGIAKAVFIFFSIAIIIVDIIVVNPSNNFPVFLGIAVVGIALTYLSGLVLAAFGDLVRNVSEIKSKLK